MSHLIGRDHYCLLFDSAQYISGIMDRSSYYIFIYGSGPKKANADNYNVTFKSRFLNRKACLISIWPGKCCRSSVWSWCCTRRRGLRWRWSRFRSPPSPSCRAWRRCSRRRSRRRRSPSCSRPAPRTRRTGNTFQTHLQALRRINPINPTIFHY